MRNPSNSSSHRGQKHCGVTKFKILKVKNKAHSNLSFLTCKIGIIISYKVCLGHKKTLLTMGILSLMFIYYDN